jgi:hypothetical protein
MKRILSPLLWMIAIGIQAFAETPSAEKTPQSPGMTLVVSLERSAIRENDDVPVEVWIRNGSDYDFSNVRLHIAAPDFLRWHIGSDTASELRQPVLVDIGRPIPAHSAVNEKFVITTASNIIDGDSFYDVSVSVFDVHVASSALQMPAGFQQRFEFLTDSARYNTFYQTGRDINIAGFGFRPLSKKAIDSSHFWNPYRQMAIDIGGDFWKIQIPFVCDPKRFQIKLTVQSKSLQITIRPRIYLSTFGWSTNIRVGLRGTMNRKELIGAVGTIMNSSGASPFSIDGNSANLTQVFQFFQTQIAKEVYSPSITPHPPRKIPRHFFVSINHFSGPIKHYRNPSDPNTEMTRADRAFMQSLLYGREIDVQNEGGTNLLFTRISKENFALTDFGHGTLLFPQRLAVRRSDMHRCHCLASNLTNCLMISLSFLEFFNLSRGATGGSLARTLQPHIEDTLHRLPRSYRHPFCKNLFTKHSSLAQFIAN